MNILKSILAVVVGLFLIFLSHTGTDFVLESLGIFTSPDKGFHTTWMVVTAFVYRSVFSLLGCFVTGLLAPSRPMFHSLILGFIGVVLNTIGAVVMIPMNISPVWYPIALIISAIPCAWLGGWFATRRRERRAMLA